jgi:hypothetical protein
MAGVGGARVPRLAAGSHPNGRNQLVTPIFLIYIIATNSGKNKFGACGEKQIQAIILVRSLMG